MPKLNKIRQPEVPVVGEPEVDGALRSELADVASGPQPDYHPPVVGEFTDADGEAMVELADGNVVPAEGWVEKPTSPVEVEHPPAPLPDDSPVEWDHTPLTREWLPEDTSHLDFESTIMTVDGVPASAVSFNPDGTAEIDDYVPPRPTLPHIDRATRPITTLHGSRDLPYMTGSCGMEAHSENPEDGARLHARCRGAVINGNGTVAVCQCPQHIGQFRCQICGTESETAEEFDETYRTCRDAEACTDALHQKAIESSKTPVSRMIREVTAKARRGETGGAKVRAQAETTTPGVERRKGRPCECGCGLMTGGGKFRPGHDARLKSTLKKAAAGGDREAMSELVARNWPAPDGPPAVDANLLASDQAKADYIATRVAARYENTPTEEAQ